MAQYDFPGWAVLEWECAPKHRDAGAKEGAEFIRKHIVPAANHSFDDFAAGRWCRVMDTNDLPLKARSWDTLPELRKS